MSNEPSNELSETTTEECSLENFARTAQDKAQLALKTSQDYVKQNPLPVILGAFLLGALVGALLSRREERPPEKLHALRDWLEDTQAQISDAVQNKTKDFLAGGYQKKLDQVVEAGKKLKFW